MDSLAVCQPAPPPGTTFKTSGFTLTRPNPAPYEFSNPNTTVVLDLNSSQYEIDKNGVLQVYWPGETGPVYHPVSVSWYALAALASYQETKKDAYLKRAIANVDYLLAGAQRTADGALWFPYKFKHLVRNDSTMQMPVPWYSGMAQGLVLSLVSRLYDETGNKKWRDTADAILLTFSPGVKPSEPWFSYVDENGYLWFELYPGTDPATHVINGHIYASWGLLDYLYLVDGSKAGVAAMFDGAATTVRDAFPRYRSPGKPPFYCAAQYCRDTYWQPAAYVTGIIHQLLALAQMTDEAAFRQQSATLQTDWATSSADWPH